MNIKNISVKNISSSTFNTFITTLRQEQKQGFMLVKFQHKAGFFCGTLSNEKLIPAIYHETLTKIDENSKELVLKKVAEIVEAAHGNVLSFVAEGEMDETEYLFQSDANKARLEESIEQLKSGNTVEMTVKVQEPKKQSRSRKAKSAEE